jgi:translation initiation factor IF-1
MMIAQRFASSQVIATGWNFPEMNEPFELGSDSGLTHPSLNETLNSMSDVSIHAVGTILENLNPVLYRVLLPNGKPILAHFSKPLLKSMPVYSIHEKVVIELTPFDFDQGRILGAAD